MLLIIGVHVKKEIMIFRRLAVSDFSLLLKWLKEPHVKAWWDKEIEWTSELIQEKYDTYVQGYKLEKGKRKKIDAYIICIDDTSIGYIQAYNAYDFERSIPLIGLPQSLAAIDMCIGAKEYLGKGIGSQALKEFLEFFCNHNYAFIFVDPEKENSAAIKMYEKVGFKKIRDDKSSDEVWMLYECSHRKC